MALINLASHEINYKIVYYGCGLSGKTTNIQHIHDRVNPAARGRLFSIATEEERTLYFDFLPLSLGDVRGLRTRFHIYTVLDGVDGVVFVVDSQIARLDENVESYLNLWENLIAQGEDPARLALVLQMNKRDLDAVFSVTELEELLNHTGSPVVEASAVQGIGVFETLKIICKQVVSKTI
jgi:signal recognition particle receptor subunit beta